MLFFTVFEMIRVVILFTAGILLAGEVSSSNEQRGASMGIQVCYGPGNCQQENTGVVLDYRWAGCADPWNCYIVLLPYLTLRPIV